MPDSNTERQRRFRLHKRGDHSLCEPERCRDARHGVTKTAPVKPAAEQVAVPEVPDTTPEDEATPGGIELAVTAYVEALGFADGDPRAILGTIAVRLAKRVDDSGALPAAVRELRVLLAQIAEVPNGGPGEVDELRLQRSRRRLDSLIVQQAS
jgi:hypothetical protein